MLVVSRTMYVFAIEIHRIYAEKKGIHFFELMFYKNVFGFPWSWVEARLCLQICHFKAQV